MAKERDTIKVFQIHLRFARGLVPLSELFNGVAFQTQAAQRWHLAPFGGSPSQPLEAALFLLLGEGMLAPLSPLSPGEERSISLDSVSDLPPEQRSSRVFSLSSLPSLAGAWCGAEASILVNTGLAESSGRGAGHLICSTSFIQP